MPLTLVVRVRLPPEPEHQQGSIVLRLVRLQLLPTRCTCDMTYPWEQAHVLFVVSEPHTRAFSRGSVAGSHISWIDVRPARPGAPGS